MVVASALRGKQQLQVSEPQTFEKEQNIVCIHVKRFGFKTENSSYKAGKRSTHNLSLLQSSDMHKEDPIAFKGCLDKLEPRSVQTFSPLPSLIQVLLNLTKAMSVNKSRLNFGNPTSLTQIFVGHVWQKSDVFTAPETIKISGKPAVPSLLLLVIQI